MNAAKSTGPYISIHKELIPDKWTCKFPYYATKQALIKLITVFTLSSRQLSSTKTDRRTSATTKVTDDVSQLQNKSRPGRLPKRNSVTLTQQKPVNSIKQKADENEVASDAAAYHEDDNFETQDNFEHDWS